MISVSIEDFYEKAHACTRLTRQEEIDCAVKMQNGDPDAREKLIRSYLPMVAGHIRRARPHMQTLAHALYCVQALEKAVDSFHFLQDSETFTHHLSWWLRQATTKFIVR